MKGSHRIIIQNAMIRYNFEIHRNITVIKGNSATGKTTLIEMIDEYYESGPSSGISLSCDKNCVTLSGRNWNVLLDTFRDSIIFIDEGNEFVLSPAFAAAVRESDNYYVIVCREGLPNLPYSVDEIYGIRESGKYAGLKQTYNELYHLYSKNDYKTPIEPDKLIVEDSNSGYQFFQNVLNKKIQK